MADRPGRGGSDDAFTRIENTKKDVRKNKVVNADDVPEQFNKGVGRVWTMLNRQRTQKGKETGGLVVNRLGYYNKIWYQVPLVNLFWAFVDDSMEPPAWSQIDAFMQNMSIVSALILALVCTFHSAVSFEEMTNVDDRYKKLTTGDPYAARPVGDLYVTGNYARWWWTEKGDGDLTPTERFNYECMLATAFLCLCLMLSVLVLATGSTSPIARPSAHTKGHQYRTVMRAYMKYVQVLIFLTLVAAVIGIIFFFQIMKMLVYIKFPDQMVAATASYGTLFVEGPETPSGFVNTAITWACYIPTLIFALCLSAGQRAAYCYPIKPVTVLSDGLNDRAIRANARAVLTKFLGRCGLPKSEDSSGGDSSVDGARQHTFLSIASGGKSNEAEVVADCILDAGITSVEELLLFVDKGDVFAIPGISVGAAAIITWYVSQNVEKLLEELKG